MNNQVRLTVKSRYEASRIADVLNKSPGHNNSSVGSYYMDGYLRRRLTEQAAVESNRK